MNAHTEQQFKKPEDKKNWLESLPMKAAKFIDDNPLMGSLTIKLREHPAFIKMMEPYHSSVDATKSLEHWVNYSAMIVMAGIIDLFGYEASSNIVALDIDIFVDSVSESMISMMGEPKIIDVRDYLSFTILTNYSIKMNPNCAFRNLCNMVTVLGEVSEETILKSATCIGAILPTLNENGAPVDIPDPDNRTIH